MSYRVLSDSGDTGIGPKSYNHPKFYQENYLSLSEGYIPLTLDLINKVKEDFRNAEHYQIGSENQYIVGFHPEDLYDPIKQLYTLGFEIVEKDGDHYTIQKISENADFDGLAELSIYILDANEARKPSN